MKNNYEKREKVCVCVCVCVKDNETYRNTIHAENVQKREKTEQRRGFFFVRTEFREWKTQQNIEREIGYKKIKEKYFRRLFLAHLLGLFLYI
jgi:hypothetical protein